MAKKVYFFVITSFLAMLAWGCGEDPTTEACLLSGDPECLEGNSGNAGTGGNSGTGGNGGTAGSGGTAGTGGTGGNSGTGGSGGTGGNAGTGGVGGGTVYDCVEDPHYGTFCSTGVGVCRRSGNWTCNSAGTGLTCSATPGQPDSRGEICGNNLDDNCNGAVDESPCTVDGGGGTGGDGGTGGTGGTAGSGGSGGTAGTGGTGGNSGNGGSGGHCSTVSNAQVTIQGGNSLTSWPNANPNQNPLSITLGVPDLLAVAASGGWSTSTTTSGARIFIWAPNVGGGGDPMPLIDSLFCRQIGINPPTPSSCNAQVIGDRKSSSYMAAFALSWQCWAYGGNSCPASIQGEVPADLFRLVGIAEPGSPVSEQGQVWRIVEMPPSCP